MPAFDPVRDAVLNSPVIQSNSFAFGRSDQSVSSTTSSPLASPSLARRATDLSALLNNDQSEPPHRPPSRSLAQILHGDKLEHSQPLRRTSTLSIEAVDDLETPAGPTRSWSSHSADSNARNPLRQSPSPRRSPSSRPSSSSASINHPASSPATRTTASPSSPTLQPRLLSIPYKPKQRKTPANSVLQPLTPEDLRSFRLVAGKGVARLLKRKRSPDLDGPPLKKIAGDAGVVASHYNARPEIGVVQRQESPIIGLKSFNNWVKSVIISKFAHPVLQGRGGRGPRGKVLDIGIGKGGDLIKWAKANTKELVGADIAAVSVEQARSRWASLQRRYTASFAAVDCYTEPLSNAFPPETFLQPFDVVSMQFCMHYAFETEAKARCMLENVTRWLRPGGVFVGTIPNAEQLLDQLDELPPDAVDLSFGNNVYSIRFEDRSNRPIYGHRYHFFLKDAVEDVPEYIVRWDNFLRLAEEYQLYPVYKEEFHQVFEEHREQKEFKELLWRMKVVDRDGESAMDEDQWEAANIYIAFVFEKR